MSIELLALGQTCNLGCSYCYEQPMRDAGNAQIGGFDFDRAIVALEAEGVGQTVAGKPGQKTGFTLFGGEPLLMRRSDLEKVCAYAAAKGVPLSVQTNGALITAWHVALFQKFYVSVGISVDGPDELNDTRWVESEAATRAATERTHGAIADLCAIGRPPSLIVTLTTVNASPDRLPRLIGWIKALIAQGVRHWNFHTLETDNASESIQLRTEHAVAAAVALMDLARSYKLAFSPWDDMKRALVGDDAEGVNCIWHACDPLTTNAVRGVDGQGGRKNCGRVAKDGVPARKADQPGHERQLALYLTPYEYGGCGGCRFFYACKGECPGTAISGDWRARTAHCATLLGTFPILEQQLAQEGKVPISLSLDRPRVEANLIEAWKKGQTLTTKAALTQKTGAVNVPHGDIPHNDRPHQDHTDQARAAKNAAEKELVTA